MLNLVIILKLLLSWDKSVLDILKNLLINLILFGLNLNLNVLNLDPVNGNIKIKLMDNKESLKMIHPLLVLKLNYHPSYSKDILK